MYLAYSELNELFHIVNRFERLVDDKVDREQKASNPIDGELQEFINIKNYLVKFIIAERIRQLTECEAKARMELSKIDN